MLCNNERASEGSRSAGKGRIRSYEATCLRATHRQTNRNSIKGKFLGELDLTIEKHCDIH